MLWLFTVIVAAGLGFFEGRRRAHIAVEDIEANLILRLRKEGIPLDGKPGGLDCFGNPVQDGP